MLSILYATLNRVQIKNQFVQTMYDSQ
jgi:hypothetical protein